MPEVVDPRWIAKAVGITILAAIVCAYGVLCLQYSIGAWQLILFPSHSKGIASLQALWPDPGWQAIAFDSDEAGHTSLNGAWLPGATAVRYSGVTMLCMANNQGLFKDLDFERAAHNLGVNLFLFDYRGFGKSAPLHPHEDTMTADAEAALAYLQNTRKLPITSIIVCGEGVGASIAATLASTHGAIPALAAVDADPNLYQRLLADKRSTLVPARMLSSDHFDLYSRLQSLKTPKLLIHSFNAAPSLSPQIQDAYDKASPPKHIANLTEATRSLDQNQQAISRFLDEYLPSSQSSK